MSVRKAVRVGNVEIAVAVPLIGLRPLFALADAAGEGATRAVTHDTAPAWWKVSAQ